MMEKPLLQINNLQTYFNIGTRVVKAADGITFGVKAGETMALVGESGCGKSVTAMSIMGLLPPDITQMRGEILFKDKDLLKMSKEEIRGIRGKDISMIFQEPMTSLNPAYTIGEQIAEAVMVHGNIEKKIAWSKAVEMLELVGIPAAAQRAKEYPHQLSGGMRQRVMIAMALVCNPRLLLADEPTTALDVTIQAQILDLIRKLVKDLNTALIMITHDLGVVAEMAQSMAVMYAGRIVEQGSVEEIFSAPRHPYTVGLMNSIPRLDGGKKQRLHTIEGLVPDLSELPVGCAFVARCEYAQEQCGFIRPLLTGSADRRQVACHYPLGGAENEHS